MLSEGIFFKEDENAYILKNDDVNTVVIYKDGDDYFYYYDDDNSILYKYIKKSQSPVFINLQNYKF